MNNRLILLFCAVLVLSFSASDALAQTKKKTTTKPAATETKATTVQTPAKTWNTIRDILAKHKGELTTLGVLKSVEGDFFSVVEDDTEVIYPLATIREIKVLKIEKSDDQDDEEPQPRLSIRLQ